MATVTHSVALQSNKPQKNIKKEKKTGRKEVLGTIDLVVQDVFQNKIRVAQYLGTIRRFASHIFQLVCRILKEFITVGDGS
jgi:hypothetical protein